MTPTRRLFLVSPFFAPLGSAVLAGPMTSPPKVFLLNRGDLIRTRAALLRPLHSQAAEANARWRLLYPAIS